MGLYPAGATPAGIQDMAGNVWEWSEDDYDNDSTRKVLRGGAWSDGTWSLRVSYRGRLNRAVRYGGVGFRCVWELLSL